MFYTAKLRSLLGKNKCCFTLRWKLQYHKSVATFPRSAKQCMWGFLSDCMGSWYVV